MTKAEAPNTQQILNALQLKQKIRRIAFEIYERNFQEKEIIVAGITGEGFEFAKRLTKEIRQISPLTVELLELKLDVHQPWRTGIELEVGATNFENKCVVVTDTVLNTGRTMTFALQPFLQVKLKRLQTAVVVYRGHRLYPVSADYVGYKLGTTIHEHVQVVLSDSAKEGVYLE